MQRPSSILITGASSGIGAALARAYATPSVVLTLTGRDSARLEDVALACRSLGAEVGAETADVTDRAGLAALIADADQRAPLDLVIANAGIDGSAYSGHERYHRTIEVNVTGVLNTILPAIDHMRPRRRGQLALMSSLAGFRGLPPAPAYCAGKAAVRSLGEALRGRLRPTGLQVSVIAPGFVASGMTAGSRRRMPFLWPADRAAAHIKRRLTRDQGRIAFPWQLYAGTWLANAMPQALADRLLGASGAGEH